MDEFIRRQRNDYSKVRFELNSKMISTSDSLQISKMELEHLTD